MIRPQGSFHYQMCVQKEKQSLALQRREVDPVAVRKIEGKCLESSEWLALIQVVARSATEDSSSILSVERTVCQD